MTFTEAEQARIAHLKGLEESLKAAHTLHNPHDTDTVYFLSHNDGTLSVYWESGGEPPQLRGILDRSEARSYYRELRDIDGFKPGDLTDNNA